MDMNPKRNIIQLDKLHAKNTWISIVNIQNNDYYGHLDNSKMNNLRN